MNEKYLYTSLNGREFLHMLGSGAIYSEDLVGINLYKEKDFLSIQISLNID